MGTAPEILLLLSDHNDDEGGDERVGGCRHPSPQRNSSGGRRKNDEGSGAGSSSDDDGEGGGGLDGDVLGAITGGGSGGRRGDGAALPEELTVPVSLRHVRIGDSLFSVTEVVEKTFLQYRERRVLTAHGATNIISNNGDHDGDGDNDALGSRDRGATSHEGSDGGDDDDDVEEEILNSSFTSVLDAFSGGGPLLAARQQQQQQRKQRQGSHGRPRRRAAVSTLAFGDLTYSLAAPSQPPGPGVERQLVHMCWRCLSCEATAIFLPCGHYAACERCAEGAAVCCVCREKVLSLVLLDEG